MEAYHQHHHYIRTKNIINNLVQTTIVLVARALLLQCSPTSLPCMPLHQQVPMKSYSYTSKSVGDLQTKHWSKTDVDTFDTYLSLQTTHSLHKQQ